MSKGTSDLFAFNLGRGVFDPMIEFPDQQALRILRSLPFRHIQHLDVDRHEPPLTIQQRRTIAFAFQRRPLCRPHAQMLDRANGSPGDKVTHQAVERGLVFRVDPFQLVRFEASNFRRPPSKQPLCPIGPGHNVPPGIEFDDRQRGIVTMGMQPGKGGGNLVALPG